VDQQPDACVGAQVKCRLTNREGMIKTVLLSAPHGRRFYVAWDGSSPDLSLMAREEFVLRSS
jgi:hypothetical protein